MKRTTNQTEIDVRFMIRRDIPEIALIEEASFEYPFTVEEIRRANKDIAFSAMVAMVRGRVVGHMLYEVHQSRLLLRSLAVTPAYRRCGVGKALIERLISELRMPKRNRITAEVRDSNLDAQLFLRDFGFRAVRVLRDYYEECGDDCYVFEYRK
jgi:ribosomal-protein-alanine N-acetyltransferase